MTTDHEPNRGPDDHPMAIQTTTPITTQSRAEDELRMSR